MAPPLEYQILKNLQAALQAIATGAGYYYDVTGVAVKLDADANVETLIGDGGDRPFIILEVLPETFTYTPSSQLRLALPFNIHFVTDSDLTEDDDMALSFYQLAADAEKAITVDRTRAGMVSDTIIVNREKRNYEGKLVWAVLTINANEHRTYGEPNG